MIPKTPIPPYYAVIFTSKRTETDDEGYGIMADRMVDLAKEQDGYIGYESYRNADGYGTTISYWQSLEAISKWKRNMEHRDAQQLGREKWYAEYKLRIAKIERDYGFE
jgi:heme-degrading monooxygenase HmoA